MRSWALCPSLPHHARLLHLHLLLESLLMEHLRPDARHLLCELTALVGGSGLTLAPAARDAHDMKAIARLEHIPATS